MSIVPGISWAVSQLKRRKVFIQPARGFFKPAIVMASSLPVPMFSFLSWLIDTSLLHRHSVIVMSLSKPYGFEKPLTAVFFCLAPRLFVGVSLPALKIGDLERS